MRPTRQVAGLLVTAGLLFATGVAGADPVRTVLNDVHTDAIDIQYTGGELRLQTRVGSAPYQYFPASDVVFQLKERARLSVPDVPEYAFLGPVDTPVWLAPQTQDPSLLFAGWDAESVPLGALAGDAVDLRLVSTDGPGNVEIFQTDPVGLPVRVFSSRDPAYRTLRQPVGPEQHVHANWAFSALGWYELTFEATATDTGGRALRSGPVTYTWYVGGDQASDVPQAPAPTTTTTTEPSPTTTTAPAVPPAGTTTTTTRPATTPCQPAQSTPSETAVLADGHVDYATRISGSTLTSRIKDGTKAGTVTWREPSRVVFHVAPAAATTVPPSGFDFLGRPGERIWQLPQTQRAGVVWLGWNTEEITASQLRGGVTWSLDRVEGPGAASIYLFNPFGQPQVLFNSGDGVPDRYEIPPGTHAHGNWSFTREGVYRVTFTQSATLAAGTQVRDTKTVTFAVGAVDPNTALPAGQPEQPGTCAGGVTPASLAQTGASPRVPLAVGGLLVLAGTLLVVLFRRGVR